MGRDRVGKWRMKRKSVGERKDRRNSIRDRESGEKERTEKELRKSN